MRIQINQQAFYEVTESADIQNQSSGNIYYQRSENQPVRNDGYILFGGEGVRYAKIPEDLNATPSIPATSLWLYNPNYGVVEVQI